MKRYISGFVAAVMLFALTAIPSLALRGSCGNAEWEIKDGVLTVTGGDIPDFTASSAAPWLKFSDRITSVVVGSGVNRIGNRAFEDMTSLLTADMGSATELGDMAFSGCRSLKAANIPDSVVYIGDSVFAECSALSSVYISQSAIHMGNGVFEACPSLSSFTGGSQRYTVADGVLLDTTEKAVYRCPSARKTPYTVPEGITAVGIGAFRDCAYLPSADLSGVGIIYDGAFYGCTSLEQVVLSDVKKIGTASFYGCGIERINFGDTLSFLGDRAFAFCASLGRADFAGNAPVCGAEVFYGCKQDFTVLASADAGGFGDTEWMGYPLLRHGVYSGSVDGIYWSIDSDTGVMILEGDCAIPDYEYAADTPWYAYRNLIETLDVRGITEIGSNSLRYSALREIKLPESVTRVGAWAFSGCDNLQNAAFAGCVTIGECAFFGDTALARVTAKKAESIGKQAFSGCISLKYVFTGETAPALGEYAFDLTEAAVLYPFGGTGYGDGEWSNVYSEAYLAGDADGNGKCNISDVSALLKFIAKWDVTVQKISADTNCDGKINITDASNILKYIAKWDIVIGIDNA